MELHGRSLIPPVRGDDVALLQRELQQLGLVIDRAEVADKLFGQTTREAVQRFQREHQLEPSGIVDELTARRINAEVARRRQPPPAENTFLVRGTLKNPDGSPVASAVIKAVDIGLRSEIDLGETRTAADGKYEIRYGRDQLRPETKTAADLIVRAFTDANAKPTESKLICSAPAEVTVDLIVGNVPLRGPSEYDQLLKAIRPYIGEIKLTDLERKDVAFLSCSAKVDRVQLATLIVANRLSRDTNLPDWLFYALGRQGVLLQLPSLPGHSLKTLRQSIDRAAERNTIRPLDSAELNRWVQQLKLVLLNTTFDASPDSGRLSIGELLGMSLVSREVQNEFLSRYLEREGSQEEFWRGLEEEDSFDSQAREDLRFTLHLGMLTRYHAPLMQQLKTLRQRGEFKSLRDLAGFDRKRWRQLLEASTTNGALNLPSDVPGRTPEERLNNYITTLRAPTEALFPSDGLRHAYVRAPHSNGTTQRFLINTPAFDLFYGNVDQFVAEHADAFAGIPDAERETTVGEIKTLQRLLRVTPNADHVRILRQAGFTSAYAIARSSRRHFRKRFTEVVEELKDSLDGVYLVLPESPDVPNGATPMMVLSGNTPEAAADIIFSQASGKAAAALHYLVNAQMLLNPGPFAINGRKESQEKTKNDFLKKNPNLESLFGSLSYCACEHCRSVYSPAAYFVDLLHWLEAPDEDLIGSLAQAKGPIHSLLNRRPDLANLALTCENTNTTLPYIDVVNEVLESFIFTHLRAVPNVDPVSYVWEDAPVDKKALEARDTGKAVAADLRAVPQYIIPEVYDYLSQGAVYPMKLPFNRSLEVMRAYLDHLGTSRAEIMEVFQTGTPASPSDEAISKERLRLNSALANIITASEAEDTKSIWHYYGFDGKAGFETTVAKVPEFLTRTGLSIEELVALLKTRFINPHIYEAGADDKKIIAIEVGDKDPCDITKMTLKNLTWTDNEITDTYHWLKRIHRFLRFWRALDWSTAEMDQALHVFGSTVQNDVLHDDASILPRLEAVDRLHRALDVPIPAVLAFWSDIDTWGEDSAYIRLMLTQPLGSDQVGPQQQSTLELFKLNGSATDLADTNKNLSDHLAPVFAALELTTIDYAAIAAHEFPDLSSPPKLNLKNLSLIYRYALLARSAGLRVKDVVTLIRLVPNDHLPFHDKDPIVAVRFVDVVQTIQNSNFSVPLLNYLFRHEEEPTRHPAPTRSLVITTLRIIAEGLAAINQQTQPVDDPLGETLRRQLSELQSLLRPLNPAEGENETTYINPDEISELVDKIDWRTENQPDVGKAFVVRLHKTLLKDLPSSFLDPDADLPKLFPTPGPADNEAKEKQFASNLLYINERFLPWLRARLQRTLIFQTFASAIGIDESISKTLIDRILESALPTPSSAKPEAAVTVFLDEQKLTELLKQVVEQGGSQAFDVLNQKTPLVLTFIRVFKAAQVAKAFQMTDAELTYLTDNGSSFENFNLNKLPLEFTKSVTETLPKELFLSWISLEQFFKIRNSLPRSEKTLVDALKDKTIPTLVETAGWDKQWVDSLLKLPPEGLGLDLANLTVADLSKLQRAIELIKRTGAPPKTLLTWANNMPDYEQAVSVIEAVKSRYDRVEWLEVARGLNDPLREKQRDAMVSFLVARMTRPHPVLTVGSPLKDAVRELQSKLNVALTSEFPSFTPLNIDGVFDADTQNAVKQFRVLVFKQVQPFGIANAATWAALDRMVGDMFDNNSLLEYFLIDIEMSSCMLTSRIKQAISSVQMFVQRCLLNLETEVKPDDIDADQWKWMKNYRVWEANRKVFLYPENWIEPELRDDKTPSFKDLETELLQNEMTDTTVKKAFVNYLYKLYEVARLDIRGFCQEERVENSEAKEIYHVFGRTWNPPYVYYYRRGIFPKGGALAKQWTSWERVDLDIEGNHLVPLVSNGRLYLFWLVFQEQPDKSVGPPNEGEPPTIWHINVSWSEYSEGKWGSKSVGQQPIVDKRRFFGTYDLVNYPARYGVKATANGQTLSIEVGEEGRSFGKPQELSSPDGEQVFDRVALLKLSSGMALQTNQKEDVEWRIYGPANSGVFGLMMKSQQLELKFPKIDSEAVVLRPKELFTDSSADLSSFLLLASPSLDDQSSKSWFPFFYRDESQSYFARPVLELITIPQDTQSSSQSTPTIKQPPKVDTKTGWAKQLPDDVAELAGFAISGG